MDLGQYYEFEGPSDQGLYLVSNKPVQLAQFCKSWGADATRYSDPFMSIVPAVSQYVGDYVFSTVTSLTEDDPFRHYVSLIIHSQHTDGIKLNGQPINPGLFVIEWTEVGKTAFSYAAIALTRGRHHLRHDVPSLTFGAQLYGIKLQEAYGLPLGQKLGEIENICIQASMIEKDYFDNDCDGRYDEEILNGIDDDKDGLIDEDVFDEFSARPQSQDFSVNVIKGGGVIFGDGINERTTDSDTTILPVSTETSTFKDTTTMQSETTTMEATSEESSTEKSTTKTTIEDLTTAIPGGKTTPWMESTTVSSHTTEKIAMLLLSTTDGTTTGTSHIATSTKSETTWKTTMTNSVIISTLIASTLGNYTTLENQATTKEEIDQTTSVTADWFDDSTTYNTTPFINITFNSTGDGNNTSTISFENTTDHTTGTNSTNISEWETTSPPTEQPVEEEKSFNIFKESQA